MADPASARQRLVTFRTRHIARVRPLFGHADGRASAAAIALHGGLAVGACWAAVSLLATGPWGWLALIAAVGFVGTRMRALGNMMHEAVHCQLARSERANRVFGQILSVLLWSDYGAYRRVHLTHHRHLGDPERDDDLRARLRAGLARCDRPLWWHLAQGVTLRALPSLPRPVLMRRDDPRWVSAARLTYGGLLVAAAWVQPLLVLSCVVLPYFTSYAMMCYASDALDHARIALHTDEMRRARNHLLPTRWLDALLQPRNDAYHLVHHLFPKIPTARMPAAHRLLLEDPEYGSVEHRLTWSTLVEVSASSAPADLEPLALDEAR